MSRILHGQRHHLQAQKEHTSFPCPARRLCRVLPAASPPAPCPTPAHRQHLRLQPEFLLQAPDATPTPVEQEAACAPKSLGTDSAEVGPRARELLPHPQTRARTYISSRSQPLVGPPAPASFRIPISELEKSLPARGRGTRPLGRGGDTWRTFGGHLYNSKAALSQGHRVCDCARTGISGTWLHLHL